MHPCGEDAPHSEPTVAAEEAQSIIASTQADVDTITALWDQYETAVESGDVNAVLAIHSGDSVRMPPNEPTIIGKEGIGSWYQKTFEQSTIELEISQKEIQILGDWAFERGAYAVTYTPKEKSEPASDNGKWVIISQKQPDGSWKRARAIWNSDNSPSGN